MADQQFSLLYRSYLLRLWREERAGWRASLEDAHTGERHGFATLERLFTFLMEQTEGGAPDDSGEEA